MNAYGQRPLTVDGVQTMARALGSVKQDAALYEAFVLDTTDPSVADYSNARLFVLTRSNLTDFADLCLSEHQATLASVQSHRVGFYRYSAQQSPPVNAFFLQDKGTNRELGYEVIDYAYTWQANNLRYVWNENRQNPLRLARRVAGFVARAIVALPSHVLFAIHEDWAARLLGQWRLLVLAR